jgi:hypothetical protein
MHEPQGARRMPLSIAEPLLTIVDEARQTATVCHFRTHVPDNTATVAKRTTLALAQLPSQSVLAAWHAHCDGLRPHEQSKRNLHRTSARGGVRAPLRTRRTGPFRLRLL